MIDIVADSFKNFADNTQEADEANISSRQQFNNFTKIEDSSKQTQGFYTNQQCIWRDKICDECGNTEIFFQIEDNLCRLTKN